MGAEDGFEGGLWGLGERGGGVVGECGCGVCIRESGSYSMCG